MRTDEMPIVKADRQFLPATELIRSAQPVAFVRV
jgi:hypothetical protein